MRYHDAVCIDRLAGEYVLGVLHGAARRRFVRLCEEREDFRTAVEDWGRRLHPLSEAADPVAPPAGVWLQIDARISPRAAQSLTVVTLWESLTWWRTATALAVVALLVVLLRPIVETPIPAVAPSESPQYVAVLEDGESQAVLVATASRAPRRLAVRFVAKIDVPADRSLELWYLPRDGGDPISAGLLRTDAQTVTLPLDTGDWEQLAASDSLAVSLEPLGGSPTGLPTGPVLYVGRCIALG